MVGSSLSSPGVSARVVAVLLAAAMGSGAGAAPQAPAAPRARLRIAVIAGEDAVNIIQQRTAVAPIVEVRDENDQPIAGALVAFVVRGGRNARFTGNARTLSVTTDASGRATSTDLTPTGTGAVVIDVTARFQGQTATTTVTQTNFATAAQASAAGGAGGAGATTGAGVGGAGAGAATGSDVAVAGAGGGGLSGIAIAGIAAAAGGGLAAAVALKSDSPAPLTAPASGTYVGPVSGSLPYVLVVTNQAGAVVNLGCTQTRIMNGTVTLDLQVSGNTIGGSGSIAVTFVAGPDNCPIPLTPFSWVYPVTLSGTTSQFSGSASRSIFLAPVGTGGSPGTETLTLEGSINQGVVSGAVSINAAAQGQSTNNGVTVNTAWSASTRIPVTLR